MKHILTAIVFLSFSLTSLAQSFKLNGNEVVFNNKLNFKKGSAELTAADKEALADVKKYLEDKSYISLLRVEGHSNGADNDQELSEKRALAAGKWLTDNGIDCKRLIIVGFGNTKPVSEDESQNNRISFVNVELRGKVIGGLPADGGGKVVAEPCR
jgi:OOP family OmpA-OmpF porin